MAELTLRKIPFSTEAESRLRMLKARTGLDRNYICRMGFCLSLEEPGVPTRPDAKLNGGREIDRYTLWGNVHVLMCLYCWFG
jgi:DNA sulfur modification protein DndE